VWGKVFSLALKSSPLAAIAVLTNRFFCREGIWPVAGQF
jgi:hypothetical protein